MQSQMTTQAHAMLTPLDRRPDASFLSDTAFFFFSSQRLERQKRKRLLAIPYYMVSFTLMQSCARGHLTKPRHLFRHKIHLCLFFLPAFLIQDSGKNRFRRNREEVFFFWGGFFFASVHTKSSTGSFFFFFYIVITYKKTSLFLFIYCIRRVFGQIGSLSCSTDICCVLSLPRFFFFFFLLCQS